jgi:hypothetical protein
MIITTDSNFKTITCGLFKFEIDPSWINGLKYKFTNEGHYRSYQEYKELPVQIVPISQISHKIRDEKTPIFKDGADDEYKELSAKDRVLRIFSGFENGDKIKPVEIYREKNMNECMNFFKMIAGCHRLHCSIAYGFKMIPAIIHRARDLFPDEPSN